MTFADRIAFIASALFALVPDVNLEATADGGFRTVDVAMGGGKSDRLAPLTAVFFGLSYNAADCRKIPAALKTEAEALAAMSIPVLDRTRRPYGCPLMGQVFRGGGRC